MPSKRKKPGQRTQGATRKAAVKHDRTPSREASSEPPLSAYQFDDSQVEDFLITGKNRGQMEALFGEEAYEELRQLSAQARSRSVFGRPRVLILPGIMGSKLGRKRTFLGHDTIWLDPLDIARGNLSRLIYRRPQGDRIIPLGVFLSAYLKLKLRLKLGGFHASFYPFDWRQSIDHLGEQLAQTIRQETVASSRYRDVYLVAHSMGGLVSRAAISNLKPDEQNKVRRVIMLGTPNHGSFVPVKPSKPC